jgi:hypothetical protein
LEHIGISILRIFFIKCWLIVFYEFNFKKITIKVSKK